MSCLDCHDPTTALLTLSDVVGVLPGKLVTAITSIDVPSGVDHEIAVPRMALAEVGVDIESVELDHVLCFHGTRVIDPDVFRREGILTLDAALEGIWEMLYSLAECSLAEWAAFRTSVEQGAGGDSGDLYRLKTRDSAHWGPHGELVRELFLQRPASFSDFLGCPEIVQDIARCYGNGLEERFRETSVACLVTFRAPPWRAVRALQAACWYIRSVFYDEEIPLLMVAPGYCGQCGSIPAVDVLDIEVIDGR